MPAVCHTSDRGTCPLGNFTVSPGSPVRATLSPMIGKTIAHYRILEKLGAGGMGEVYLAEDTELNRQVALKFLPSGYSSAPDVLARFKREAQAAAALNHPNIITIYQVAMYEDRPYIAMEHVEGATLSEHVREHALPVKTILDLTIQIADGLAKAHAAGVVHRDLKPDNILVDADGRPRILDFGLAKLAGVTKITQESSTLGTIYYMSPEQTRGGDVDHRADLFSLGTLLYEMIAGQLPFQGEHSSAVMYAITNEGAQPLARYNNEASDELQRIVSKLMAKNPGERYQSAADLVADLRMEARSGESDVRPAVTATGATVTAAAVTATGATVTPAPATTPAPGTTKRSPAMWAAIVAVVVVAAAIAVFNPFKKGAAPPGEGRPMLVVLPFENLGVSDDEYFADGITEEITSRLATIAGLGVISRTSAMRYKGTNKSLEEIADELGVQFVIEGTVRWDKSQSPARIRITPQLIRVSDDTHVWASNYERQLDRIFEVQADIATEIAGAMEVTLLERERESIARVPTENSEAYAYYLRGIKADREGTGFGTGMVEDAMSMFQKAVELDPEFAVAWAWLSNTHASYYHNGWDRTPARLKMAKECAHRALALAPDDADAQAAMALYHYWGLKDYDTAMSWIEKAEISRPGDPMHIETHAYILRRLGRFDEAAELLDQALILNPYNRSTMLSLAECHIVRGRLDAGQPYIDRAVTLDPDDPVNYWYLSIVERVRGNVAGSRRALESYRGNDTAVIPYIWWNHHFFAGEFDDAIAAVARVTADAYMDEGGVFPNALLRGLAYRAKGNHATAKREFESAVSYFDAHIEERPDDHRLYSGLALAQAALGQTEAAVANGRKSVEMYPMSKDRYGGAWRLMEMANIYAVAGYVDEAIKQIDEVLTIDCWPTATWYRMNPLFESLREDPRFEEMLRKHDPSV
jgi:non-specific serine/threonine protein kinase